MPRPRSSTVAPLNDSSASSAPLMTSGAMPKRANAFSTPATNSPALPASREADVATNRTASTPASSHCPAYSAAIATVRRIASGSIIPVRSTP